MDHSSSHLPQQKLKTSSSSQKIDQHSTQFATSFPMLVVGQPPLRIAENQRILVVFANLDSSDNLKGKVASNLQDNMDGAMPKGVMEMAKKQLSLII